MEMGDVTARVREYIARNDIPVAQMSSDLGIEERRLRPGEGDKFSAAEFLDICVYLHVRPEQFRKRRIGV